MFCSGNRIIFSHSQLALRLMSTLVARCSSTKQPTSPMTTSRPLGMKRIRARRGAGSPTGSTITWSSKTASLKQEAISTPTSGEPTVNVAKTQTCAERGSVKVGLTGDHRPGSAKTRLLPAIPASSNSVTTPPSGLSNDSHTTLWIQCHGWRFIDGPGYSYWSFEDSFDPARTEVGPTQTPGLSPRTWNSSTPTHTTIPKSHVFNLSMWILRDVRGLRVHSIGFKTRTCPGFQPRDDPGQIRRCHLAARWDELLGVLA
ncbi:hypothetical protein BDP55DRAFT_628192 [Colletotrichum godetiae]|uniref:Uncharacterized protein n=1 Tax=Colletotrichum godetiae TaxID=1209918 RepID=A0AAJ0F0D1_9PEZI|nr:uncharacterized protein BDP55DRAFT_628192 [Colletotrichum godetiae]KAK1690536.1 hypothetical protein BDP55DRAFT_628192 [Colletotrichum godetiae]